MSCTDPIADMLTVIRNGLQANKNSVTVPHSKIKVGICGVLKSEGYITAFDVLDTKPAKTIKIGLKYGSHGESVIQTLDRESTPGRRTYAGSKDKALKPVIRGFGIKIVTTSRGVMSDRDCRKQKLGGEVLCTVK
jgi:small subunit ribosomal protein S8